MFFTLRWQEEQDDESFQTVYGPALVFTLVNLVAPVLVRFFITFELYHDRQLVQVLKLSMSWACF